MKKRQANYELLKITSMFMIIIWHIIMYTNIKETASQPILYLIYFIQTICVVHVNSYILVTGYFQCKGKFNPKKVFSIINASWFYRVVITLCVLIFNLHYLDDVTIFRNFLPYNSSSYWFINAYIILYLISPFINILINNINKKQHQKLIVLLIFLVSIMTSLSNQTFFNNNYGLSPVTFILMYIIGSYLRMYPLEKEKYLKDKNNNQKRKTFLLLFIMLFMSNFLIKMFAEVVLTSPNEIIVYIKTVLSNMVTNYDNPLVILGTVAYFGLFSTLTIKWDKLSLFINKISGLTLGIYMIHESITFRHMGYKFLGFKSNYTYDSFTIIFKIIIVAAIVFIICGIVEWIRQILFEQIKKTKISKKIRNYFIKIFNKNKLFQIP